ncbi:MAG: hypothetical protein Q8O43_05000 [Dehalococcoidia bacterium]|nr:hypothetical protein [Dehalococcoidia bacterium]
MAKVVATFKLEDGIYSKLRGIAEKEGRGVSEILKNPKGRVPRAEHVGECKGGEYSVRFTIIAHPALSQAKLASLSATSLARGYLREALTDWLRNKKNISTPDFVAFIKEQKNIGRSWSEISSLVLERYGISLNKEQLESLSS